jgi:sugar phosphate isomerase/epimerase
MKLGIFSWYGFKAGISHRLERIRQAGFDSTMLWWGDEPEGEKPFSKSTIRKIVDLGLEVENVHVPFGNPNDLWSSDERVRSTHGNKNIRYIEECALCGYGMIVMHISSKLLVEKPNQYGIDSMRVLVELAEKLDVCIAIENTRRVALVEALLYSIASPNIGLCYDTSHGRLYEPEDFYLLHKYGKWLKCLHMSDNDGLEDRHWNIGHGIIDWDRFAVCFPSATYKGLLSVEVYPKDPNVSEENHLREACGSLVRLREKIISRDGDGIDTAR